MWLLTPASINLISTVFSHYLNFLHTQEMLAKKVKKERLDQEETWVKEDPED